MNQMKRELLKERPPLIHESWNFHWANVIRNLRSYGRASDLELERFVVMERRNRGLPELKFE